MHQTIAQVMALRETLPKRFRKPVYVVLTDAQGETVKVEAELKPMGSGDTLSFTIPDNWMGRKFSVSVDRR